MSKIIGEKCAVIGVADTSEISNDAALLAHMGLFTLQHRGTESSGIVTSQNGDNLLKHAELGLVKDVYGPKDLKRLVGNIAIGHNRYATNGERYDKRAIQPFNFHSMGLAFAHNGNIPDTENLSNQLERRHVRTNAMNDSRMMCTLISENLRNNGDIVESIKESTPYFIGAYSCVASFGGTLVGFRDPYGIRPLAIGKRDDAYIIASESCALDTIGAQFIREVEPGEIVATDGKNIESHRFADANPKLDIFEFIYFARPDSIINGKVVDQVRRNFGQTLANNFSPNADKEEDIVVVPVPTTSIPAAEAYAEAIGLPVRNAIVKSGYVGRTFIESEQEDRVAKLRLKHNMMPHLIKGKDVILIDDSIVRLNTIPAIVERARCLGAKSVTVLIASPPVRYPDFYGIDTPEQKYLAAAKWSIKEMQKKISCDRLGFLSISQTVEATGLPYDTFNLSPFNGKYPIPIGKNKNKLFIPKCKKYLD